MLFSGSGSLEIQGQYNNGIQSKSYVLFEKGVNVYVNAANHGIKGSAAIINGGIINVETAGLGARIKEQWFQDLFKGKKIYQDGQVALGVYKQGKAPATLSTDCYVDAVTGATLTSNGVNDMIQKCLSDNQSAIEAFKN